MSELTTFLQQLQDAPQRIDFAQTMAIIAQYYEFTPTAFTNGEQHNAAGENNGSCQIFAFGQLHHLSDEQVLNCFGDYYRKDVLENPNASDHQNIRQFMINGWGGIDFQATSQALSAKQSTSV